MAFYEKPLDNAGELGQEWDVRNLDGRTGWNKGRREPQ